MKPLTTAEYPTPAQRPAYSLMDCRASREALGLAPLHWRQGLRQVLAAIAAQSIFGSNFWLYFGFIYQLCLCALARGYCC